MPSPSHRYEFRSADVLRLLGGSLLPVVGFALAMHAGARWSWWPKPRPALDTERTVLLHQADAARDPGHADVVLVGDSSCLMNVSARRLGEKLARPVLNLATFSFLDLNAHRLLLEEFNRHHPTPPRAIVLLMHPEALRRLDSEPYYLAALTNYLAGSDQTRTDPTAGEVLGVEICRGRLLARALPAPLGGAYGRRYGFSPDLEAFMKAERGSLIDPEPQPFSGVPEYRLAPTLEKASRAFRSALRPGVRLWVGMTPVPQGFAGADYPARRDQLLRAWGEWLGASVLLSELPATLPDSAFVRTTHLREEAAGDYTDRLATLLKPATQ
ncbi:MAG TPA: hypothetical protein VNH84_04050 [Candidatus Saccharimonadales bacterium]|nr:hypothetical protein [Candidatus Saccharimonadales bacterium]